VQATGIHHLELTLLLLVLLVAGLATLAQRFKIPYPIVLFIGGVVLSLVPHLPRIALNPDVVFLVVLPPLLYVGGFNTSWRDFNKNLVSILMLAFGLVGFTVFGVAVGTGWLIPGFDYRLGAVLGAVVSTTDAIAAGAIAKRLGLPRRIVDVLEGESLVNDASGLLALQFAVALVVAGQRPPPGLAMLELMWLISGGVSVGLLAAFLIHRASLNITDSPVEITLSLATPYMAYLAAEGIHASGVLSVVVCGLYLGRKNSEVLSINARLDSSAVWKTLEFGLNGLVFILMGLQLPLILGGIHNLSGGQLARYGATFAILVIALRIICISRRRDCLLDPARPAAPGRAETRRQTGFYRGLDGHARGLIAGRGYLTAHRTPGRLPVPAAERHHLSHFLCDLRHPGLAGTHFAGCDQKAGTLGRQHSEHGGAAGPPAYPEHGFGISQGPGEGFEARTRDHLRGHDPPLRWPRHPGRSGGPGAARARARPGPV